MGMLFAREQFRTESTASFGILTTEREVEPTETCETEQWAYTWFQEVCMFPERTPRCLLGRRQHLEVEFLFCGR